MMQVFKTAFSRFIGHYQKKNLRILSDNPIIVFLQCQYQQIKQIRIKASFQSHSISKMALLYDGSKTQLESQRGQSNNHLKLQQDANNVNFDICKTDQQQICLSLFILRFSSQIFKIFACTKTLRLKLVRKNSIFKLKVPQDKINPIFLKPYFLGRQVRPANHAFLAAPWLTSQGQTIFKVFQGLDRIQRFSCAQKGERCWIDVLMNGRIKKSAVMQKVSSRASLGDVEARRRL